MAFVELVAFLGVFVVLIAMGKYVAYGLIFNFVAMGSLVLVEVILGVVKAVKQKREKKMYYYDRDKY